MQKFVPESTQDTLMACFCLFVFGKETKQIKMQMRQNLMDRFSKLIQSEDCYSHPSVQAFVHRLHMIQPQQVPNSAEQFFLRDEKRMERECFTFLAYNRRYGYVGDKFTFCYLFAECFSVDVYLYQPEQVHISVMPFAKYSMHLYHQKNDHRFYLMFPEIDLRPCPFITPKGVQRNSLRRIRMPKYYLNKQPMIPPAVKEHTVHHVCVYEQKDMYIVKSSDWPTDQYAYIYSQYEPHGELELLSCVSKAGQTGAWFRLKSVPCAIYVAVGSNSEQAVRIESRFVTF